MAKVPTGQVQGGRLEIRPSYPRRHLNRRNDGEIRSLAAPAALAQDVGAALDPGVMVGWAGGEAVHYDNVRRSGASQTASGNPMLLLGFELRNVDLAGSGLSLN